MQATRYPRTRLARIDPTPAGSELLPLTYRLLVLLSSCGRGWWVRIEMVAVGLQSGPRSRRRELPNHIKQLVLIGGPPAGGWWSRRVTSGGIPAVTENP